MQSGPGDAERERALARQWHAAQLNLGLAIALLVASGVWWFVDGATWQSAAFTVVGIGLVVAAASNVRQQQRNRRRRQERQDPR